MAGAQEEVARLEGEAVGSWRKGTGVLPAKRMGDLCPGVRGGELTLSLFHLQVAVEHVRGIARAEQSSYFTVSSPHLINWGNNTRSPQRLSHSTVPLTQFLCPPTP